MRQQEVEVSRKKLNCLQRDYEIRFSHEFSLKVQVC